MPHKIDTIIMILNIVIFSFRKTAPRIIANKSDVSRSDDTMATGRMETGPQHDDIGKV